MSSYKNISLPYPASMTQDLCPATALLKNIFARCRSGQKDAGITICYRIADASHELAKMEVDVPAELSIKHLEAMEKSITDAEFRYVFVYRNDKPALFLYFQLFTVTSQNFKLNLGKAFVQHIVHLFLDVKRAKVLVAGNAMRNGLQAYCYNKKELQPSDALDALTAVAEQLAETEGAAAVILPGLPEASPTDNKMLHHMGYAAPWEDRVMEMSVLPAWLSLTDYVNALSRKYKTRAQKILAGIEGISIQALSLAEIDRYISDINLLFLQVVDKQPFSLSRSGAAYVRSLKELYGNDFEVFGYFKGEKIIGFYSGIATTSAYEIYYVGIDTKAGNEHPLYFHILMAGLERAILLKKETLKLGRTSFDAKASLGARPIDSGSMIKLRHVPDVAVKWFAKYFSGAEDNKWKLRTPIKLVGSVSA